VTTDREAARAVLSERAFAYVEAVEAERDELRAKLELNPPVDFEAMATAVAVAATNLEAAVKAARLNLNTAGTMQMVPATNTAAAYRNLDEGLRMYSNEIGRVIARHGSIPMA
jgi:hypothetical protein